MIKMNYRFSICTLLLLIGCHPPPPPQTADHDPWKANVVKGIARATWLSSRGDEVSDLAILIAVPNRIRIEAMDPLSDVWGMIASDGRHMLLALPHAGKVYRGRGSRKRLASILQLDWKIERWIRVLSGVSRDEGVHYSAYRRVNGISFPHRIDVRSPDGVALMNIQYRDVSFSNEVDPAFFRMRLR